MKKPWPIHRHLQQPILSMKRTKRRQVLTGTLGPMLPPRSTPRADMSRFIRPPIQCTSIHQCCLRRARRTTELLTLLDRTLRSHSALHACQILDVQREQLGRLRRCDETSMRGTCDQLVSIDLARKIEEGPSQTPDSTSISIRSQSLQYQSASSSQLQRHQSRLPSKVSIPSSFFPNLVTRASSSQNGALQYLRSPRSNFSRHIRPRSSDLQHRRQHIRDCRCISCLRCYPHPYVHFEAFFFPIRTNVWVLGPVVGAMTHNMLPKRFLHFFSLPV